MKYIKLTIIILLFSFLESGSLTASALNESAASSLVETCQNSVNIEISKEMIKNAYTAKACGGFEVSLLPNSLTATATLEILELNEPITVPWQINLISSIYQFDIKNKEAYATSTPLYLHFNYNDNKKYLRQIYYYDKNKNSWRPLPTKDHPEGKYATASVYFPYARVALFSNPFILGEGKASWYKYKGGNFAASPDFPKGSKLRVYSLESYAKKQSFVEVIVNDYGPDRKKHPEVVVDLDKIAFGKLAPLSSGTIKIRVEPIFVNKAVGRAVTAGDFKANPQPVINSRASVLMNEKNGEVLFNKNATTTLPLASLTKLVGIKVFLDTRPTLNKVVAYSVNDESYNHKYVEYKWQSASLKIKNGETLTMENLIYAGLVGSANNAIETLVRVSGLKRQAFIDKMNKTVKEWGATSTSFIEPTGLSPKNVSSPLDYAIITKEVYTHPILEKASIMPEYSFFTINTKKKHRILNTNHFLNGGVNLNLNGSKTGYLDEAGYCLMMRAKAPNGENLIAIIMGAPTREQSFMEAEELLRYGIKNISVINL